MESFICLSALLIPLTLFLKTVNYCKQQDAEFFWKYLTKPNCKMNNNIFINIVGITFILMGYGSFLIQQIFNEASIYALLIYSLQLCCSLIGIIIFFVNRFINTTLFYLAIQCIFILPINFFFFYELDLLAALTLTPFWALNCFLFFNCKFIWIHNLHHTCD